MNRDTHLDTEKLRFDWRDLPAVTADFPGTGGEIRADLEDFVVTEVPSYLPSGSGVHAYAFIEKRGLTTFDVVTALKDLGVPGQDVGYAGQKDKHAVTRQWLSVPAQFAGQLQALDDVEGVEVLEVSRHNNKLRIGHLRANRFDVRVRNPLFAWPLRAQEIIAHLDTVGLPNYFGPQRFGRFNSNAVDAVRILRGEDVSGGRGIRRFFMSALQSHVFNWTLKTRIERGLYTRVLAGERAQKHDTGGVFVVDDAEQESPRAERLEISAILPLYGKKIGISDGDAGELEREVLDWFGLSSEDFRASDGARRISRVRLDDVSLEATEDGYLVCFTLPSGAYATCLLRELTKVESDFLV